MLCCALKLVWDLLSRPSAQTVHPFICLSVYPSVSPLPRPPFVSLFLRRPVNPFILPFIHPSVFPCLVCPSVRPSARPSSFLQLLCQSIRLSVRLSVHSFSRLFVLQFIHLSVRFSFHQCVCLSVRLFIPSVDKICPSGHRSVHPFVCPSFQPSTPLSFRSSVRPSV